MILYYQPHQQRKSEAFFFEALRHRHPEAEISFSHFEVPIEKMLSVLPPFKQVTTTDKYYYSRKIEEEIQTIEIVDQFKVIVLEFLKNYGTHE